jgi:hypothetical protein
MKYGILILLFLTGCGAAPTGSDGTQVQGSSPVAAPTVHSYVYTIAGNGVSYAADLYWDMSTPGQSDSPIATHTDGVTPDTYPIGGVNTFSQITNHGGGTLTITLTRDGVLVQTKTVLANTAITMSEDI